MPCSAMPPGGAHLLQPPLHAPAVLRLRGRRVGAAPLPPCADVVDLKREHQRALRARTLMGHVENLMGYILSLYCIYRWAGLLLVTSTSHTITGLVAAMPWAWGGHGMAWRCRTWHGRREHGVAWQGTG